MNVQGFSPDHQAYEMVIGLETHVELSTQTKAFCGCSAAYGGEPNAQVCPVCMGLPGALPTLNREAVRLAALAGLALECRVNPLSAFDRKHYFYPDLPKGYQITQFFHPLCQDGHLTLETEAGEKTIGITRIHLEEDAGKLLHRNRQNTLLDMNRCGVPLIEIVSEPDIRSAEEAVAYLVELRAILTYAGVSDCRMNEGSLRCDVNLSLRRPGEPLGVRTEMKNLNSFQSVERAIAAEYARQAALLNGEQVIRQETRRFDPKTGQTHSLRSKGNSADYRYFPEPDLPPIIISEEELEELETSLPVLPRQRRMRYRRDYALPPDVAGYLTGERWLAEYFERAVAFSENPIALAHLLVGEVFAQLTLRGERAGERSEGCLPVTPQHLAQLADMIAQGQVNSSTGKAILAALFQQDTDPAAYAAKHQLLTLRDEEALMEAAQEALAENAALVEAYHGGKETVLRALMGKAMAKTGGRADAPRLEALLVELLRKQRDKG